MQLRPYQQQAIDATLSYWLGGGGHPLIVIPTGGGKSPVMAGLMQRLLAGWRGTRILCVTHVKELIEQNYDKMLRLWPDAPAGVHSAGLGRRDSGHDIIFGGVQSLFRKPTALGRRDVVIIDEAHMVSRHDTAMYGQLLAGLRTLNPNLRVLGLTATPFRTDNGLLTEPWRDQPPMFSDIVYEIDMRTLIAEGYLSRLVPYGTEQQLNVEGVGTRNGDYVPGELERAVNIDFVNEAIVDETMRAAREFDRHSWLMFCAGVQHAKNMHALLTNRDVPCGVVLGDTPSAERSELIRLFKEKELRCLISVGVLTTGFDAPGVDLISLVRPTKSLVLYSQILGRGTRPAPGKQDCIVLDFARVTVELGPVDQIDGSKSPGRSGDAPAKECPECHRLIPTATLKCECGFEFPKPRVEDKLSLRSAGAKVISGEDNPPQWFDVTNVSYIEHEKAGRKMLRVIYHAGLFEKISEFVFFDHGGYATARAIEWWKKRMLGAIVPNCTAEAMNLCAMLRRPQRIECKPRWYTDEHGKRRKAWEIVDVDFGDRAPLAKAADEDNNAHSHCL